MHVIERHAQPEKFGTIPAAMWWPIVTLGTIGYGDVVPVTALGRVVASITIFVGLIMVALPIGIVATAFADEIHRRDFVVTWGMVARVPLFAELEATEIADIMRTRRSRPLYVFRRGWGGGSRAQARARSARRRSFLRRDRGAASHAPVSRRDRGHANQPTRARCPRPAGPDGSGPPNRRAYP